MLKSLHISNYAIIDQLEISFSENLNIITGETGAGKSILLGALSLILGQRADTSVLFNAEKKCVVEGIFDISEYQLKSFFEKEDLDHEPLTTIRREINAKGKSRAFINDTPVKLNILKKLTSQLIDVHAQHETLELSGSEFQMIVLDALAENAQLLNQYQLHFKEYKKNLKYLQELVERNQKASRDLDYFQFQLEEFEKAQLENQYEQEELESELQTLTNAEEIKKTLLQSSELLQQGDYAILPLLNDLRSKISSISKYNSGAAQLNERLDSASIELKDISNELEHLEQQVFYDEERITEVNERLNIIYKLQKKHGANTIEELLKVQDDLEHQVNSIADLSAEIKKLEQQIFLEEKELKALATALSENRKAVVPSFEKNVNTLLKEVGMPAAKLQVKMNSDKENLYSKGMDEITFMFSANPGSAPKEISKVASGGELSRLMLSIKSLVAGSTALPTLVFDEIDAGISGETGQKVGKILERLSLKHQVICITHLPQIAGKGSKHFFVYKETEKASAKTKLRILNKDERILEIAKMLSGEKPSAAAVENAKELLSN